VFCFIQDWLNFEFDAMDITVRNLTLGNQWLHQMAKASQEAGLTLQYCMAPARHTLTSLQLPVVTQVCVCVCVYVYVCVYIYIYIYVCVCVCVC